MRRARRAFFSVKRRRPRAHRRRPNPIGIVPRQRARNSDQRPVAHRARARGNDVPFPRDGKKHASSRLAIDVGAIRNRLGATPFDEND